MPGIKGIEVGAPGMIWSQDLAKLFVSLFNLLSHIMNPDHSLPSS